MEPPGFEQLAQLAELPEKNPGPVGRMDRDATILMANAAARRFLRNEDIIGRSWVELCPGMTTEIWQRVLDRDPGADLITHEAEVDGPQCVLFTHVRSDSGDTIFVYGADITARRQQEKLARVQAAQLAEFARFPEMNPGPVIRTDADGNLRLANAAARALFGTELLDKRWSDLCPGIDDQLWTRILHAGEVVEHEARLGERSFSLAHRYDPQSRLVFVYEPT